MISFQFGPCTRDNGVCLQLQRTDGLSSKATDGLPLDHTVCYFFELYYYKGFSIANLFSIVSLAVIFTKA